MLFFTKRKKLENLYYEWIKENGVKDCPFSVISYLVGEGLIDEDKAMKFIAEKCGQKKGEQQ